MFPTHVSQCQFPWRCPSGRRLRFHVRTDLGCVPNPQLKVQFRQQALEPARMPTGFHPHAHLLSLGRQLTVELLRFFPVPESPLLQFSSLAIHICDLLKSRVVIQSLYLVCICPIR